MSELRRIPVQLSRTDILDVAQAVELALRSGLSDPLERRFYALRARATGWLADYAETSRPASYNGSYGDDLERPTAPVGLELRIRARLAERVTQLARVLRSDRQALTLRVVDVIDAMLDDLADGVSDPHNSPPTTSRPTADADVHNDAAGNQSDRGPVS